MTSELHLKKKKGPRVRFAPSPTGPMHIGNARTALFNFLFARHNQGTFILRIEDTDIERSKKKWEKNIINSLKWLKLFWDEGPIFKKNHQDYIGEYGPYRQSERKKIYKKYIQKLYEENHLYWCFCTKEELQAQKEELMSRGEAPRYTGHCRNLTENQIKKFKAKGRRGILRLKVPSKIIKFQDLIKGEIKFDSNLLGDIAIAKNFETPLYNFAVVIDDYEMRITHIIRGEDHLSNTPKQIIFQDILNFPHPKYAHLPLILGPRRNKLSKREAPVAISNYKKAGYLPEALINFLALLGWNPKNEEELWEREELIKHFSLKNIQKSPAIFNIEKLNWFNSYYIRQTPLEKLVDDILTHLQKTGREKIEGEYLKKIVILYQERLKKLSEFSDLANFFFEDRLKFDRKLLYWKEMTKDDIIKSLQKSKKIILSIKKENFNKKAIQDALIKEAEKEDDRGKLLWPLRVALTGKAASPPPFDIIEILGREKTIKRIEEAIENLKN